MIDGIRQHIAARSAEVLYFRFRRNGVPLVAGTNEKITVTTTIYSTAGVVLLSAQAMTAVSSGWYSLEVDSSAWTCGSGYRASVTVEIEEAT